MTASHRTLRRLARAATIALALGAATAASAQGYGDPYADPYADPYTAAPAANGWSGPYENQNGTRALARPNRPDVGAASNRFTANEVVSAGHRFFGATSGSLGALTERIFARFGLPNGYILGEEGSGAYIGGLTYGEGVMHTRNAGQHRIFWQGPSIGLDVGAQGSRVMMLVYNLPHVNAALGRFGGGGGEAFVVGGFGMRVLQKNGVLVVPIRTGVGARLGINLNYLKFTAKPTWNPF